MRKVRLTHVILVCALLAAAGCSDSSSTSAMASQCEATCTVIEEACSSTTSDCAQDCEDDLDTCPTEMQAVLDCVNGSELQCDPEQDQGLAEAPCEAEHTALSVCGADAF